MFEGEGGGWWMPLGLVTVAVAQNMAQCLYIYKFSTTKEKDSSPIPNFKNPTVLLLPH